MATQKVTITATDNIGRTESINLKLPPLTVSRLTKAANHTYPDGQPYSLLRSELSNMMDYAHYGNYMYLTKSQLKKLEVFDNLIYHKFFNYTLTIKIN